jgi:hypothetical protein
MFDIGRHKVIGDRRRDRQDEAVTDNRNLLDEAVMIPDEFRVSNHRIEAVPVRKAFFCHDKNVRRSVMLIDISIDVAAETRDIFLRERSSGFKGKKLLRGVDLDIEHVRASPSQRYDQIGLALDIGSFQAVGRGVQPSSHRNIMSSANDVRKQLFLLKIGARHRSIG